MPSRGTNNRPGGRAHDGPHRGARDRTLGRRLFWSHTDLSPCILPTPCLICLEDLEGLPRRRPYHHTRPVGHNGAGTEYAYP